MQSVIPAVLWLILVCYDKLSMVTSLHYILMLFVFKLLGCSTPAGSGPFNSSCPFSCPQGYYFPEMDSVSCEPVDAGCFMPFPKMEGSCPAQCPAGFWSDAGATECKPIDPGCGGTFPATSSCPEICSLGFYSTGGTLCLPVDGGKTTVNLRLIDSCISYCFFFRDRLLRRKSKVV